MPILLRGIEGIKAYSGFRLGKSSWMEVSQDMINAFASATDDWDWLSVDEGRARRGPFGKPVAQNTLILSLVVPLLNDVCVLEELGMNVIHGIDRLRFLGPVPVDSSVRLDVAVKNVDVSDERGYWVLACKMECDLSDMPVLEAEIVYCVGPALHEPNRIAAVG
ncbi:MaoC/PaaZ C-terminal domain-containing protein [Paraburkholderia sp.]|uniref:MaoC/PaaZ C-terminal domain-containing protein n=1 Tax=Paraburkholderia sp. TaxID=1926495 RepID=UPI0023925B27|nr:MaoC/PaaZ C-terminal domain-containing protein [Paraburkholderia sp.]MDE1180046.1 MaoC/PaaZ C-terminal domain-containing protein [Paraburkholderia sp.]